MRCAIMTVIICVIANVSFGQYYINDHFEDDSLSSIWIQTAGMQSNYTVANSYLTITNTEGGVFDGPWRTVRFRTAFIATDSLYISSAFNCIESQYKKFYISLLNNEDECITFFLIWDSPNPWLLLEGPNHSCGLSISTYYEPHDIEIYRSAGIMTVKWDDTIRWQCAVNDTISSIEFSFGDCPYGCPNGLLTPISIDSIYCYAWTLLVIDTIFVDNGPEPMNLLNHSPTVKWHLLSALCEDQQRYEIEVGIDNEWSAAEMWDIGPVFDADTFITYAGLPLVDGNTYYLRLRVHNGLAWSEWYNTSFRMNSVPTVPVNKHPDVLEPVNTTTPTLWVLNSTDPDGDPLFYDFEVLDFSENVVASASGIPGQPDTSGWTVDVPLVENGFYYWQARAFDGYEYSAWSFGTLFLINETEEFPSSFLVYYPPDTDNGQVYDKPVEFRWGTSTDPDPSDSVRYKLLIAIDPGFVFVATHDSVYQTRYLVGDLNYGTHYWWKVQAFDTKGNMTPSTNTADFWTWVLGDANGDRAVNVGDAVFLVSYIFRGGPPPIRLKAGDANGDCQVNVGDAVYLIGYVFRGGSPPKVGCAK